MHLSISPSKINKLKAVKKLKITLNKPFKPIALGISLIKAFL
jgi:hypothetical protein